MMSMQATHLHVLPILIAAVVYFFLGGLWYSPKLFGNFWLKHEGLHLVEMKPSPLAYVAEFILDLVTAIVLALFIELLNINTAADGALVGFLIWIGFVATSQLSAVVWGKRTFKIFLVNAGFLLLGLLIMGAIIGGFKMS